MTYHIQETIFPDRHTVAVMNPSTGEFLPVAEIEELPPYPGNNAPQFRTRDGIRSTEGESFEAFARMVAKFYSPFERLRPADYTGELFG